MIALVHNIVSHKTCVKCGESKEHSEYHKHGRSLQPRCKTCRNKDYRIARGGDGTDGRKNVVLTENGRTCLKCGEAKSWNEFAKDVHGFNQKTATCSKCRNKHSREMYPEKRSGIKDRPDKLKRLYGTTYEHVVRTLEKQHGLCANRACGKEISLEVKGTMKNRAVIDHDHKTGKFRALLCSHCNGSLGLIETKRNMLLGLIEYLTEHT